MKPFNFNALKMNAVETDPNGVINEHTIFTFEQDEDIVYAQYVGGEIIRGQLIGRITDDKLHFRYCQIDTDGNLDGGESYCDLQYSDDGLIQIIENFQWESRDEQGRNVIQEMR